MPSNYKAQYSPKSPGRIQVPMKTICNYLIFFLCTSLCWGLNFEHKNINLDQFITTVVAYCKKDRIPIEKNNREKETIETPKYISDFGLGLAKLTERKISWEEFLSKIQSMVSGDTKTNVEKLLYEMFVEEVSGEDEVKAKLTKSASSPTPRKTKDEINADAKKKADEAEPIAVTKIVLDSIGNEADKTYMYFGKTSEILDEILKGLTKTLKVEDVTNLSEIKKLVDGVTRACTPFYKTGTFIFLMTLFTILIIATTVFTVIVVRRFMNAKNEPPPITPRV